LAVKSNGTVVVWGDNTYGQTNAPAGLTNAKTIAGGSAHSLSSESDGTMVAWGNNYFGQINFPPGLIQVLAIAAGGYHGLAVSTLTFSPLVFNLIPPNLQLTATGFQLQVDGAAGITPVVITPRQIWRIGRPSSPIRRWLAHCHFWILRPQVFRVVSIGLGNSNTVLTGAIRT
jgi:hypothetical protein